MDRRLWFFVGVALAAALVALAWWLRETPAWAWLALLAAALSLFLSIGAAVTGTWKGIFVNRRNLWSLSQTQILGWSVLVLSGFVAVWFARWGSDDPLLIDIPVELLWLMGISVTGIAGAGAIQHGKLRRDVDIKLEEIGVPRLHRYFDAFVKDYLRDMRGKERLDAAKVRDELEPLREHAHKAMRGTQAWDWGLAVQPSRTRHTTGGIERRRAFLAWYHDYLIATRPTGGLVRNLEPREASPWDLMEGDEVANETRGEVGRIQLLVLSLIAWIGYSVVLWQHLRGDDLAALPAFSTGLAQMVLLSNGAYLGTKAVPQPTDLDLDVQGTLQSVPRQRELAAGTVPKPARAPVPA